jgi:hypothetical protein
MSDWKLDRQTAYVPDVIPDADLAMYRKANFGHPLLSTWSDAPKIDRERIGLFGFSMGGYTGLVVIGSIPDFRKDLPGCEGNRLLACEPLRNNESPTGPSVRDPRIRDRRSQPRHLLPCGESESSKRTDSMVEFRPQTRRSVRFRMLWPRHQKSTALKA